MGYGLWAMGYGLWAMGYGLWAMGYGLWAMGYGLWAILTTLENRYIKASNIKCVPASTKMTNLALGNADLLPGRLPGRPKTLAFSSLLVDV
jgi:hypothetical protein